MKKKTDNNLFSHIYAVTECTKKNCAVEKRKLEAINKKNKDEMVRLMKSDLSNKQFMKEMSKIQKKINKTDENINLVECQLKKCYQQTHDMVMFSIDSILKRVNKKTEPKKYDMIMKYKKLFSNKIETKDLIKLHNISYNW
jgi:hypothetical protein